VDVAVVRALRVLADYERVYPIGADVCARRAESVRACEADVSQYVSPRSLPEDRFTRIWHGADASHGNYVEAIAELRERKRWLRERVECERCQRGVERAQAKWVVATSSPVGEPVEHLLCPRCAREVRRTARGDLVGRVFVLGLIFVAVTILTLAMSVVADAVH
jgi:hypothetical protein